MTPTPTPRTLTIARPDLEAAAAAGVIAPPAAEALWQFLAARPSTAMPVGAASGLVPGPRFGFTNVLYYFGGLLAIGAATLFMTLGFQQLGPWALVAICLAYGAGCVLAARALDRRGLEVPAGILATLAVCLVPLATWAAQHGLGLWPESGLDRYAQYHTHIDWRWITLEFATLAAAAVALQRLRYPFLMMPVAITLWYMSMDLARLVVAPTEALAWTFYRDFSMFFGLAMTLLAFWIDARSRRVDASAPGSRRDYAFWLYWLGMLTFWGALSARPAAGELAKALYALLNLGFVFLGVLLARRVFTLCGGLGVAAYLGHLSWKVFADSLLFPLVLTAIGLALVAAGVWWNKHEAAVHAALWRRVPPALRGWLPVPAAG